MNSIDHDYWAKKILAFLVDRLKNFSGGEKTVYYSDLANSISYPEPRQGSAFGNNIGNSLGAMGHFFDNIKIDNWNDRIPLIQTLVVLKSDGLPSSGLKEFEKEYPYLSKEKQKDFVQKEYEKIFEFGDRWNSVLSSLGIQPFLNITKQNDSIGNFFNPFGSDGSPEHQALCEYIKRTPSLVNLPIDSVGIREYPLKSGDKVDVVFETKEMITAVEIKSIRSDENDLERGLFQCIKYHATLVAEEKVNGKRRKVKCYLVIQGPAPKEIHKKNSILLINLLENISPK
ncbi:hypothetical protein [Leptospira santarosai]|uniref:Uncharacterized protein n=1 Tax=Leptospira santarosai str. MOR084 TaxID=1049984 RepID=A0A0E2BRV5_9LEPT|nr:hypothetical protein [Leptospira santarosai]EKO34187.1 hypothetical protein LEP1GSC179_0704 [Leptospira santarosai str. MOR084]